MRNVAAARTAPTARFDVPPRGSSATATAAAAVTTSSGSGSDGDGNGGIRRPKASFFERCGKALAKKRSFWKKRKDEEK
jgi:hypothetical protein